MKTSLNGWQQSFRIILVHEDSTIMAYAGVWSSLYRGGVSGLRGPILDILGTYLPNNNVCNPNKEKCSGMIMTYAFAVKFEAVRSNFTDCSGQWCPIWGHHVYIVMLSISSSLSSATYRWQWWRQCRIFKNCLRKFLKLFFAQCQIYVGDYGQTLIKRGKLTGSKIIKSFTEILILFSQHRNRILM